MAKPDGRVEKGQSLKRAISAQRWNDLCDAADIVHGRRGGVTAGEGHRSKTWVELPCKNINTIEGIQQWQTCYLVRTFLDEKGGGACGHVNTFLPGLIYDDHNYRYASFCVAVEPIGPGAFGRVAVSGVVPVRIGRALGISAHAGMFLTKNNKNDFPVINASGVARVLSSPCKLSEFDQSNRSFAEEDRVVLCDLSQKNFLARYILSPGDTWEKGSDFSLQEYNYFNSYNSSAFNILVRNNFQTIAAQSAEDLWLDWTPADPSFHLLNNNSGVAVKGTPVFLQTPPFIGGYDVNISSAQDGQVLKLSVGKWVNGTLQQ